SGRLWGEMELRRVCEEALRHTRGDEAEAMIGAGTVELTRFANNTIHQNVASREASLQVRVVVGKRVGMITTNDLGPEGIARAEQNSSDIGRIDVDAVATEAIEKCVLAQGPHDLAPGTYEVVLEPYAVNDIAQFLGGSLTGQSVEEGRSFVGDKIGQKVTGD